VDAPTEARTSSLEFELDPELLATARLFAAAVARGSGWPDETIHDVKVAVSEACTRAIQRAGAARSDERVRIDATEREGRLVFSVAGPAGEPGTSPPRFGDLDDLEELGDLDLVAALFDDVREETVEGVTIVTFSAPTDQPSDPRRGVGGSKPSGGVTPS
jgi:anti-sigma regulatory factor (Ser/Thr protein kinase)